MEVLENPQEINPDIWAGFLAGTTNYYVINIGTTRDGAANWCKENLDAVLPVPDTEYEFEVRLISPLAQK